MNRTGQHDPIYMDYSATTPLDTRVLDAMHPYFSEHFANSKAVHRFGQVAEHAIEEARQTVARLLNCNPSEVVFTSGGSESNNLALRGLAQYARALDKPFTLVTSPVEHAAVSATARQLHDVFGVALRVVNIDRYGRVDPDDLRAALRSLPPDGIALVSLMHANNEIGTRSPVDEYAAIAHESGAYFHTDAVQSPSHYALDVAGWDVDMLSLSSHKFYGPKGVGVFVIREGVPILSPVTGASHEGYRRAGTHNTPGIVGTAAALQLAHEQRDDYTARLRGLRDRLIAAVLDAVPDCELTGHPTDRLSGHASFAIKDVESSLLLMHLDQHGIMASSGSACKTGNEQPSTLLQALGYGPAWTRGGLRLSMGHSNTEEHVARVIETLPGAVEAVRKLKTLASS